MSQHVLFIDTGSVCGAYQRVLSERCITVTVCRDARHIAANVDRHRFDLVVVVAASVSAPAILTLVSEALGAATTPTIVLGYPSTTISDVTARFAASVDQWLPLGIENEEFLARVLCLLDRTRDLLHLSADTDLPGKPWMDNQIQSRIDASRDFAVAYLDIDRFKSVVDSYGFARAQDFLKAMAESLRGAADRAGIPRVDLGHIGGDDFLALCDPDQLLPVTKFTVRAFEHAADLLYDPLDARRGYIEIPNRWGTGTPRRAALVTLSVGVAESTGTGRRLRSPREVAAVASEMKKIAKSQPGSYVAIDRRRSADRAAPVHAAA